MQSKPLILEKEVKSLIGEDKEPDIVFFTPTLDVENYIRHVLECGYEGLEKKLASLGAKVSRILDESGP